MEIFDINSLDVKTLRLLLAIADTGSVSAGAARRNMTQSTASYGLDKLRAAFNDPIFIRSGRGVAPSARGGEIIAGCRDLVERLDLLAAPVTFDPGTATRDFVIGTAAYEVETLLPSLRQILAKEAPDSRLVIRAQDLDNQVERLAHDWDLGLMTAPVETCTRSETADDVMKRMSEGRFRHMPVVEGAQLVGVVSIGDVVKNRIATLEHEADAMRDYIMTG